MRARVRVKASVRVRVRVRIMSRGRDETIYQSEKNKATITSFQ